MRKITSSPWGKPESVTWLTDEMTGEPVAIAFVSTASHGGYYVGPELLQRIPSRWRAVSFGGRGKAGWFEEDCDWSMVALTFPTVFPVHAQEAARATWQHFIAPKFAPSNRDA